MKINLTLIAAIAMGATILLFSTNGCTATNPPAESGANTNATATTGLNVSVTTSTAGGSYNPSHVLAIWIENSAGQYVKTLLVNAGIRSNYLTYYSAANSSKNTTDAITGATSNSFGTRTCTWNGKDKSGALVPDGIYNVCMELTDKNATGSFSKFPFTKGLAADTQTPANAKSFSTISIKWTPL